MKPVTLSFEATFVFDSDSDRTVAELQEAGTKALKDAIEHAQAEGHTHDLIDTSMMLESVKAFPGYILLEKPLSKRQMRSLADEDEHGYISGVVGVDLSDFVDNDLEGILDILSEKLTNTGILSDISYEVVGHEGDLLHVKVSGIFAVDDEDDE